MRRCTIKRNIHAAPTAVLLLGAWVCAASANQPPAVDAGSDRDSVRLNYRVSLAATVEDDATPTENISLLWKQISGPAVAEIISPNSAITRVIFSQAGVYTFLLEASDGELTGIDSIRITVIDSVAFMILAPQNNGEIEIGMPYVIRWQIDQHKACDVYCSLDSGLTWLELTTEGSEYDSFVWHVDPSYADSSRYGILKVEEYQNPSCCTTTEFVLVDSRDGIRHHGQRKSGDRVTMRGDAWICGLTMNGRARICAYDAQGRLALDARHGVCGTPAVPVKRSRMLLHDVARR